MCPFYRVPGPGCHPAWTPFIIGGVGGAEGFTPFNALFHKHTQTHTHIHAHMCTCARAPRPAQRFACILTHTTHRPKPCPGKAVSPSCLFSVSLSICYCSNVGVGQRARKRLLFLGGDASGSMLMPLAPQPREGWVGRERGVALCAGTWVPRVSSFKGEKVRGTSQGGKRKGRRNSWSALSSRRWR